jgi:hypothetical protein
MAAPVITNATDTSGEALPVDRRGLYDAPQPAPTGNGSEVLPVVLRDLTERQEHGRRKYGTPLRAHNGRSAIQDALEEAYDQVMYLAQLRMEWPERVARPRVVASDISGRHTGASGSDRGGAMQRRRTPPWPGVLRGLRLAQADGAAR